MKRNVLIVAIAATLVSAAAWAGPGMGFGPGGFGAGGFGPGGGGYGMGGGFCAQQNMAALGLTAEQRDKIAAIQTEVSTRQLDLMTSMRELRTQAFRAGGTVDPATYDAMANLRQQMQEVRREGHDRIGAVLTPEQRSQWQGGGRWGPWRG